MAISCPALAPAVDRSWIDGEMRKEPRPRVIVIGAGLGGLAIAIRLLSAGLDVTVVERSSEVGGRAGRIRKDGFTFDRGPSLITMPELIDDLLTLAGTTVARELSLRPLEPFYHIFWWGEPYSFAFSGQAEVMRDQIGRFNIADARRYTAFIDHTRRIHREVIEWAGHRPFLRLLDFLRILPRMARLGAFRSVAEFVGSYFEDPHVRQAFGFHPLFIGGDPFRVPAVYIALVYLQVSGGVWYAAGGLWAVVDALRRQVLRGGRIITGRAVRRILVSSGRVAGVRLDDDTSLPADLIVSNIDVTATFELLGIRKRRPRMSMSCYLLHLGTERPFPTLNHHSFLVGRDYQGFIRSVTYDGRLPRDVSLYVHAPSRTDPMMAEGGGEALSVLVPVPNLTGDPIWPAAADVLRERVLEALESSRGLGLQGLSSAIRLEHAWTPLDFRDRLGAEHGNAFGPEPLLLQSAYFRQHNRYRWPRGLYHVGSNTHPGAGIPGVLLSAEVTAGLIREDLLLPAASPAAAKGYAS